MGNTMNKFNKVLNVIIIVLMISATIAFTINVIVFGIGELQTNTLSYYLLIMINRKILVIRQNMRIILCQDLEIV